MQYLWREGLLTLGYLMSKNLGWLVLSIASKTITNGLCKSDVALSLQKSEAGPYAELQ